MPPDAPNPGRIAVTALCMASLAGAAPLAAALPDRAPAHVAVDACVKEEGSPEDVFIACSIPRPPDDTPPAWAWWCGWPAPLPASGMDASGKWQKISSVCDGASLYAFAVRASDAVLVFVVNGGEGQAKFSLRVRLPAGAYTAERFAFVPKDAETVPRVDGLESVVLARTGFAWKMGTLAEGWGAVYRFVNRSARVQAAFRAVRTGLRAEAPHSRGPCRRILAALAECADDVALLASTSPARRDVVVRAVDRALLTLGEAQALLRNFRDRGRLSKRGADEIGAAMDALEQALAQAASASLNVVPELSSEDPGEEGVRTIVITAANAGSRSLSFIKLGIAAPAGARVWPPEEAAIPSLAPGQSAAARFRVRFNGSVDLSAIQGSVTYVARRTPIHLWVRNFWPPPAQNRPAAGPDAASPDAAHGNGVQ